MERFDRLIQPQSTGLLLVIKAATAANPAAWRRHILAAQTATLDRTDVIVALVNEKHLFPFPQEDLWYNFTSRSGE